MPRNLVLALREELVCVSEAVLGDLLEALL